MDDLGFPPLKETTHLFKSPGLRCSTPGAGDDRFRGVTPGATGATGDADVVKNPWMFSRDILVFSTFWKLSLNRINTHHLLKNPKP